MLLRLLLVVLMAAGPVPVKFCNCAASATPPTSSDPSSSQSPSVTKTCSCGHREKLSETPAADSRTGHHPGCELHTADQSPPGGHDRECPAVKPRVTMSDAVVTPVTDVPTDDALALRLEAGWPKVGERFRTSTRSQSALPSVPLFIAFLNLRI